MHRNLLPAVAILAVVGASGCGGSGSGNAFGVSSVPVTTDSLRLVLSTRSSTYGAGQPVPLRLTITNAATQTAVLTLTRPVGQSFQITRGAETAYPPCPLTGPSQPVTVQLPAGQTQTTDFTWNQHVFANGPVPGGTYSAVALLPVTQLTIGDQAQSVPTGGLGTGPLALALTSPCPQDPVDAVPSQVLVGFAPGTTQTQAAQALKVWGTVESFDPELEFATLNLTPGKCVVDALASIKNLQEVTSAEANGLTCGT